MRRRDNIRHDQPKQPQAESAAAKPAYEPTLDERRAELARKLAIFAADWRRCRRGDCRRRRACSAPAAGCAAPPRRERPFDAERWERDKVWLKRALERRLAEIGGEET